MSQFKEALAIVSFGYYKMYSVAENYEHGNIAITKSNAAK